MKLFVNAAVLTSKTRPVVGSCFHVNGSRPLRIHTLEGESEQRSSSRSSVLAFETSQEIFVYRMPLEGSQLPFSSCNEPRKKNNTYDWNPTMWNSSVTLAIWHISYWRWYRDVPRSPMLYFAAKLVADKLYWCGQLHVWSCTFTARLIEKRKATYFLFRKVFWVNTNADILTFTKVSTDILSHFFLCQTRHLVCVYEWSGNVHLAVARSRKRYLDKSR